MNRIFCKLWDARRGQVVVASELASRHGKGKGARMVRAALAAVVVFAAHSALAQSVGGGVASGKASTAISPQTADCADAATRTARAGGGNGIAIGCGADASGDASTAVGFQSEASGAQSTASGAAALASGDGGVAHGALSEASGVESTASGYYSAATADGATAHGAESVASGIESTAGGFLSTASGAGATAHGAESLASGDYATSLAWPRRPPAPAPRRWVSLHRRRRGKHRGRRLGAGRHLPDPGAGRGRRGLR
ncbi:ESPR-type extended signal peptide-containing protein [Pseudoxanthomonas sp. UC29_72]